MDESVVEIILLLVVYVVFPVATIVFFRRREANIRHVFEGSGTAAFDAMPPVEELLADPEGWRVRLGDRLTVVNAMSAPVVSDSGTTEWYSAFVVDRGGVAHDLVTSPDAEVVVTSAQWVALVFEIPLKNDTFDRPPENLERCTRMLRSRVAAARSRRQGRGVGLLAVSAALLVATFWIRASEQRRVADARAQIEAALRQAPKPTGDEERDQVALVMHALSLPSEPEPDFSMAWTLFLGSVVCGFGGTVLLVRRPRDVLSTSIPEGSVGGI